MTAEELNAALALRLDEYAPWRWPAARKEGARWLVGDSLSINAGISRGKWKAGDMSGTELLELDALCFSLTKDDSALQCAEFLGTSYERPAEPEPNPNGSRALVTTTPPARPARTADDPAQRHQQPPQSVDAEKGILCAMLLVPDAVIPKARELLPSAAFHIPAHRLIFEGLLELYQEGSCELISLIHWLQGGNQLEAAGGWAYLTEVKTYLATAGAFSSHAAIVLETFRRRELLRLSTETISRANEGYEVGALVENLRIGAEQIATVGDSQITPVRALMDIERSPPNSRNILLADRYLCIAGSILFVGPSGIGKSSASVQQDVLWALGRPAFDIRPARPLRILTIQAENDDDDLVEMREGVCSGLHLSDEDRQAVRENVFYDTICSKTGDNFLRYVESKLRQIPALDILRIDHFQAYFGGDVKDTAQISSFLRTGLQPILEEHQVANILNHHTPKTINRDTSEWRTSDWAYAGASVAELTNWARAVLVIDPTHADHVFRFIAGKRGGHIGWVNEAGELEKIRPFCHASDGLYWRAATDDDLAQLDAATPATSLAKRKEKTAADVKAFVPISGAISKNALISMTQASGIGEKRTLRFIAELIDAGELFEWRIPRPKTNPEIKISRHEQTLL